MGNQATSHLAFLKGFLVRPWRVASPIPSGRKLAARVAEQIDPSPGGAVLELGPGTGAVTRAIRDRGVAETDLVLIESNPDFVRLLRSTFPVARVIEGDAFAFAELLGTQSRLFSGIVCGLPVVREPLARKRAFLEAALAGLVPGRPFVQFSYSNTPPLPNPAGVEITRVATVWQNVWPMRIWVYRRPQG
ncbi:MAG TPA: rRNA adenine N-6-methyltransferase family protein [Rhizomicrobium sp.]